MHKPKAHVINLNKRPERWARCQEIWNPYFELVRFNAIDTPGRGALGCKKSHLELASEMLKTEPMAIVIEDDAMPSPYFDSFGMRCIAEAQQRIVEFDYINCGPFLDLSSIRLKKASLLPSPSPLFLKANVSYNTHFVIYTRLALDVLRWSTGSPLPVDVFLGHNTSRQWVPVRLLATQYTSPSDIPRASVDYNQLYELTEKMLADAVPEDSLP